jgi:hypothetical protein
VTTNAGPRAHGGFQAQVSSLLYYLLLRKLDFDEIALEPEYGEDAEVTLTSATGITVREWVQCKERSEGNAFTKGDLKEILERSHAGESTAKVMKRDPTVHLTILVIGSVKADVWQQFSPHQLRDVSPESWPPIFSDAFPPEYTHSGTRGPAADPILTRVRLLQLPPRRRLFSECEVVLRDWYSVSRGISAEVLDELWKLLSDRSTDSPLRRTILPQQLRRIIEAGIAGRGRWMTEWEFLDRDRDRPAEYLKGEGPGWYDFSAHRYERLPAWSEAEDAFVAGRSLAISGPAGIGKTTLCRYLAFRFLSTDPRRRVFYLRLTPGCKLDDERAFFTASLHEGVLFILDDHHLAPEQGDRVVERYLQAATMAGVAASLVVVTTRVVGAASSGSRSRTEEVDSKLSIRRIAEQEFRSFFLSLRYQGWLDTPLDEAALARLTGCNVGLAMILARCAADLRSHGSERVFSHETTYELIRSWLLELVAHADDKEYFEREILPIFILGAYDLPIPDDYTGAAPSLYETGFLQEHPEYEECYSTHSRLAYLVHNGADRLSRVRREPAPALPVILKYLDRYPEWLPAICSRLAHRREHHDLLRKLLQLREGFIVQILRGAAELDMYIPLSLDEITTVLRGVRWVDDAAAQRLLRTLVQARHTQGIPFLATLIDPSGGESSHERNRIGRADLAEVTTFIRLAWKIDDALVRSILEHELGEALERLLRSIVARTTTRLSEVGQLFFLLNRAGRCAWTFVDSLYEWWVESAPFQAHIRAGRNGWNVPDWVRYCRELHAIHRPSDASTYLGEVVTVDSVVNAIVVQRRFTNQISALLVALRQLVPRLANSIVNELVESYLQEFADAVLAGGGLLEVARALGVVVRIDRRRGIEIARFIERPLARRLAAETRHRILGSALHTIRHGVGVSYARRLSGALSAESLRIWLEEDDGLEQVGKTLSNVAEVSPELGAEIRANLDLSRILAHPHVSALRGYAFLLRGFITATLAEERARTRDLLLGNAELKEQCARCWKHVTASSEATLAIWFLREAGFTEADSYRLLDIEDSVRQFDEVLVRLVGKEPSLRGAATGLWTLANVRPDLASRALEEQITRKELPAEDAPLFVRRYGRSTPKLPPRADLVDLGRFLQTSAAIDADLASRAAALPESEEAARQAVRETNLGRLSDFIAGLHAASRKRALELLARLDSPQVWTEQLRANDDVKNVIRYAGTLTRVSVGVGERFILHAVQTQADAILDVLSREANLMLIADWLRLLKTSAPEVTRSFVYESTDLLFDTGAYDASLRHQLEVVNALLGVRRFDLAQKFAERALASRWQFAWMHRLPDWIWYMRKAAWIAKKLAYVDFTQELFSGVTASQFADLVMGESNPLMSALALRVTLSTRGRGLSRFAEVAHSQLQYVRGAVRTHQQYPVPRLIALSLLGGDTDLLISELKAFSSGFIENVLPWELGLLRIAAGLGSEAASAALVSPAAAALCSEWYERRAEEHAPNLFFALSAHASPAETLPRAVRERVKREARRRAGDERSDAVKFLLQSAAGEAELRFMPDYLFTFVRDTVLRAMYLPFTNDVVSADRSETYGRGLPS